MLKAKTKKNSGERKDEEKWDSKEIMKERKKINKSKIIY